MNSALVAEKKSPSHDSIDPIWEIRLRTWARRNYVAGHNRDPHWHPIILDEMDRIDHER